MLYHVTFTLNGFGSDDPAKIAYSHACLDILLQGLVRMNRLYLRLYPGTPDMYDLYKAGKVWYEQEPAGREWWQPIGAFIQLGSGDCEDVSAWRVAELREKAKYRDAEHPHGVAARAVIKRDDLPNKSTLFHIQVVYPDLLSARKWNPDFDARVASGDDPRIEDPSARMGMR